jgi:hypothetical protein
MTESLLSPAFLFRFAVPCQHLGSPCDSAPATLDPRYRLLSFGAFEQQRQFADLRAGWHESGLVFDLHVTGKKQSLWCRQNRMEESDGLRLWIDTRDAHSVHRATRFCHCFICLPAGAEGRLNQPVCSMLPINRARENPRPVEPRELQLRSQTRRDGYHLQVGIPAAALTGYDPAEQPRLGFFYAVVDRELGTQTFSVGEEFPYQEDPSVWGTLELSPSGAKRTSRKST